MPTPSVEIEGQAGAVAQPPMERVDQPPLEPVDDEQAPPPPRTTTREPMDQLVTPELPAGWPDSAADAAPIDRGLLDLRCEGDARGNRVCVWSPGSDIYGGPCAFGRDGELSVSSMVAWPDYRVVDQSLWPTLNWQSATLVMRYDAALALQWTRAWHREVQPPALSIMAYGLVALPDGGMAWGGQDCPLDAATGQCGKGSADALLIGLDAQGEVDWSFRFGDPIGLDRISDLRNGPDGDLYVGGHFGGYVAGPAALELPGHEPLRSAGGMDHYLLRRGAGGQVRWAQSWGSTGDEANGIRLGTDAQGDVAVSGHYATPEGHLGFLRRVAPDGTLRYEHTLPSLYISRVAIAGDELVVTLGGRPALVDSAGRTRALSSMEAPPHPAGIGHMHVTSRGTILVAGDAGSFVVELDREGNALRAHDFFGATGGWWYGGFCVADDGERVALVGAVTQNTDFGILEQPLELARRSAFVLLLSDW